MCEFDSYINTITGGLRISKKKKAEIADEFKDHLESLKTEFVEKGFSEGESVKRAIEEFGEPGDIKKKLHKTLFGFRNSCNIIFGLFITFIMIIFYYLPISGIAIAYENYNSAVEASPMLFYGDRGFVNSVLFFIPIGYFLPIILTRVYKVLQIALTFSAIGILTGLFYGIALTNSINVGFLSVFFASGLLGGMAGYLLLITVDKLSMIRKIFDNR